MCAQTQNKCSSCDSGDEGTSLYIDRQTDRREAFERYQQKGISGTFVTIKLRQTTVVYLLLVRARTANVQYVAWINSITCHKELRKIMIKYRSKVKPMLIRHNYGNIFWMEVSLYSLSLLQLVYSFTSTLFTPEAKQSALPIGEGASWLQIRGATFREQNPSPSLGRETWLAGRPVSRLVNSSVMNTGWNAQYNGEILRKSWFATALFNNLAIILNCNFVKKEKVAKNLASSGIRTLDRSARN